MIVMQEDTDERTSRKSYPLAHHDACLMRFN